MATKTKRSRWIRRDGRKSRRQRGYGAEHDARRRALPPFVAGRLEALAPKLRAIAASGVQLNATSLSAIDSDIDAIASSIASLDERWHEG